MSDVGIKESQDVLEAVKALAKAYKEAKADGTLDVKDLSKLGAVLVSFKDAAIGAKDVPLELKSLDSEEINALISDLISLVTLVVEAVSA